MMATQEITLKSLIDPALVETNRSGQITAAQKVMAKKQPTINVGLAILALLAILSFVPVLGLVVFEPTFRSPIFVVTWLVVAGGIIGLAWFQHQRQKARIQEDLTANIIQQADGELVFRWGSYAIQIPGRRVSIERDRGGLLPGIPYRFYILPQTGFILSAEPLAPPNERHIKDSLLKILARANYFNLKNLEANRQGRLTGWQMFTRLPTLLPGLPLFLVAGCVGFRVYQIQFASYPEPAMRPQFLIETFIMAMMMPILLVLGAIWAARKGKAFETNNEARPMNWQARAWLLLGGGLLLLACYVCSRLGQIQSFGYPEAGGGLSPQLDSAIFGSIAMLLLILGGVGVVRHRIVELWTRQVVSVEGMGRGESVTTRQTYKDEDGRKRTTTTTTYYYWIGEHRFDVSERAYSALVDGLRYRLYYLPHNRTLVNIEPLSSTPEEMAGPQD